MKLLCKASTNFYLLFIILLMSTVRIANATVPDISGTYTGVLQGTENSCGPFPGGPFVGPASPLESEVVVITLTLLDQNTGVFTGTGSSGTGASITVTGQVDGLGNVTSGALTANAAGEDLTTVINFSGSTFNNGVINFTGTGADTTSTPGVDICLSVTILTTLTRGDGSNLVIIPEATNSATLTNIQTLNVQVQGITNEIGGRVGNILRGGGFGFNLNENSVKLEGKANGINAGDGIPVGFGAWASYSRSEFENDFAALAFDGNRNNFLTGIDYSPLESMVVGVALGYEFSDIDTKVNRGNIETDGYSVIPYVGILINDVLSVDGSFGYTHVKADQYRTDPASGTIITSTPESHRVFGMFNLNGLWAHNNWLLGSSIGLLWADNFQDEFTESSGAVVAEQDTELRQFRIGGNVAYSYNEYEPFVSLNYSNDLQITEISVASGPQPANDKDDFLFGAGVRYFGRNGISGNLEYSKRIDREDFDEDTISLTIRIDY